MEMGEILRKFISESGKIFVCNNCDFHLAKEPDLISKVLSFITLHLIQSQTFFFCLQLFQGQSGPAYLFTDAYNIITDSLEQDKYMTTGRHIISTIRCSGCHGPIGWTYIYAYSQDQKYKEGKFIIERAYIIDVDNSAVEIPNYLQTSHNLITKINYFHQK